MAEKQQVLNIKAAIPLVGDVFAQAAILTAGKDAIKEAEAKLSEALGHDFKFECSVDNVRAQKIGTPPADAAPPPPANAAARTAAPAAGPGPTPPPPPAEA